MRTLDLGCGDSPRNPFEVEEVWGIDIREIDKPNVKKADLVLDAIPFTDDYFDYITTKPHPDLLVRKMSVSIGLNQGYNGGEFEIHSYKGDGDIKYDIRRFRLQKGNAIVFPSFQLHGIHPVTEGTRKALVAWFFGPKWK